MLTKIIFEKNNKKNEKCIFKILWGLDKGLYCKFIHDSSLIFIRYTLG